jgi:hypothetical protein
VGRVTLHRLHEVGDEVEPLLELDVYLGPGLLDAVREDSDAVVVRDEPDGYDSQNYNETEWHIPYTQIDNTSERL